VAGFPMLPPESFGKRAFSMENPTPAPTPATFKYDDEHLVRYKHYRINDDTTLVEIRKEPQGLWNGIWDLKDGKWSMNMDAVLETAYETLIMPNTQLVESPCTYSDRRGQNSPLDGENAPTGYCYYHMNHNLAQNNTKMEQRRVFDMLLWQGLGPETNANFNASLYNSSIDHVIDELEGEYTSHSGSLKAIGVTCSSNSSVGTADIDGVHSTYSNFMRSDIPIPSRRGECARQFGAETLACILGMQERKWLS
jgi:hypothetical protein